MKEIYSSCPQCSGNGKESISSIVEGEPVNTEITCRTCAGSTVISNLFLNKDLIDMLNDMKDKLDDIFEKVNE